MGDAVRKEQILATAHGSNGVPKLIEMHPVLLSNRCVFPIQKGHRDCWERVLTKMLHQIDARSDIIMRTGRPAHLAGTKWQTANAVVAAPFGSELPGAVARTKCLRH